MTLIATIKKEYESGPETRLKRRQQIPVAAESKFFRRPDGVGSIVEFTVELRNFEGNLVPHKQNLKDIDITASFTPKGGEEREVNAELVCVSEGVYFVALLAEEPGVYRTCVSLLDEEIGRFPFF